MAFANGDDSDVDDDDGDDMEVAACDPMATEEADVDWKAEDEAAAAAEADEEGSDEVAVVVGCPVFERSKELCNLERSVLVLLAAVTSEASLPTRTVQGAEGDQ